MRTVGSGPLAHYRTVGSLDNNLPNSLSCGVGEGRATGGVCGINPCGNVRFVVVGAVFSGPVFDVSSTFLATCPWQAPPTPTSPRYQLSGAWMAPLSNPGAEGVLS